MPLDIDRIQALCLDVDGTLMDTDDQMVRRLSRLLAPLGIFFPERELQQAARRIVMAVETPVNAMLGVLDQFGIDEKLAAFDDMIYRNGWRKTMKVYQMIPGTAEALNALHAHYPLAIVSARGARGVRAFLEHFQLNALFDVVVTGQTRPLTKPHPDPILWAADQLGIPAEACLMVGDTTVDILSGKAAGAQTVGVLCGFGRRRELRAAGADQILPSTANLPDILLGGDATRESTAS